MRWRLSNANTITHTDAHEKARLLSETVKEWEHEEVEATHPGAKLA